MKTISRLGFSLLFSCLLNPAWAQNVATKTTLPKDTVSQAPDTLIINKLVYKRISNCVTFGFFVVKNTLNSQDEGFSFNYHFAFKRLNWQAGLLRGTDFNGGILSSDYNRQFNQLHLAIGNKIEKRKTMAFAYAGPSYMFGEYFESPTSLQKEVFSSFGLYGQAGFVYKPIYDVGIGMAAWGDFNARYSVFGLSIIAYFSSSYQGKMRY